MLSLVALMVVAVMNCGAPVGPAGARPSAPDAEAARSEYVVALGRLGQGERPSAAEAQLSEFLFGTSRQPPLGLVKPVALAANGNDLLICDSALNAVFRYDGAARTLTEARLDPTPLKPVGIAVAPTGAIVVADVGANAVMHYDASGSLRATLRLANDSLRPADAAFVDDEIWVSNAAASRIEVFRAGDGSFVRSIGVRGNGRGEFGVPLGLVAFEDSSVGIVDMLNARVQVLGRDGAWRRSIGRAGDRVGAFGRPKDVAVGPDGTVFVVDAASQRVHAFTSEGEPLLAFGGPGYVTGSLSMPAGICVAPIGLMARGEGRVDDEPDYLVCVAEQLAEPGIRVYGWYGTRAQAARIAAGSRLRARPEGSVDTPNPHWSAQHCSSCHLQDGDQVRAIPTGAVDETCLSCHDGHRARAEPHPIGRLARHGTIQTPADWTTVDDRLSCITCHDVRRHCNRSSERPAVNPAMLRYHEPERPLAFCLKCHASTDDWQLSPHRQLAADGTLRSQTCAFCHNDTREPAADGVRRFAADLREDSSAVCLTCHTKHWDYSTEGHVERAMTADTLARLADQTARRGDGDASGIQSSVLPLSHERVACYTCHNPHAVGLFPPGSALAARATNREDAAVSLRLNRMELCLSCHLK